MCIANPLAFGFFLGVVSTLVVEIIAVFIWAAKNSGGK